MFRVDVKNRIKQMKISKDKDRKVCVDLSPDQWYL